jgi:hypothetical protein
MAEKVRIRQEDNELRKMAGMPLLPSLKDGETAGVTEVGIRNLMDKIIVEGPISDTPLKADTPEGE